jgi:Ca2+-transporting ATPase
VHSTTRRLSSTNTVIAAAFTDKILILLSVAALISLAIGIYEDVRPLPDDASEADKQKIHWIEGFAIIIAVLIVVLSSSINGTALFFLFLNEVDES